MRQTRPGRTCLTPRRAIAVAGLSAIAIAASGCGGNSDAEAKFRAAFKEEFADASWYQHITGMRLADDGQFKITTDFGSEDEWNDTILLICGDAINLALDSKAQEIESVGVFGTEDGVGAQCA